MARILHWSLGLGHWSVIPVEDRQSVPVQVEHVLLAIRHILEMIRFSHTLFALPFALLAAVMAWTTNARSGDRVSFQWRDLFGILLCMVCARSAAMAFNRLADRHLDAMNPRTASRHLPAGI